MAKLEDFFNERMVNAAPVEWKGPFPDPYKELSPEEAAAFEAENAKVLNRKRDVAPIKSKVIQNPYEVKTVAQPVKPELQAVAESSKKVMPEDLASIKQGLIRGMAPAEVPTSKSLPARVSPTGNIDLKAIRDQVAREGEKTDWTDLLLGLIPVGIDAMTGGYGAALPGASKYYLDTVKDNKDRNRKLENFLLDIEKSRAIASAKSKAGDKSFQSVNIVDPDTQEVIKANFDKNTGKYYSPSGRPLDSEKIRAGYSVIPEEWTRRSDISLKNKKIAADYTPRLDPETGLISRATSEGMAPIGQQKGKLNPKQEKDLTQLTDKFITTDAYKKPAATLSSVSGVEKLLTQANDFKNASAANFARKELAKMAEGAGRLSDQDVEMVGGSPSLKAKIKRFTNLQNTGVPLTDIDIAELREVASILAKDAKRKLSESIGRLDKTYVKEYGGIKGSVVNKMGAYTPGMSKPSKPENSGFPITVRKDGKMATVMNKKELEEAINEGWE